MRLLLAARVLATACALPFCGCKTEGPADAGSAAGQPAASSQVLARVGARTITLGDYQAALNRLDQFDQQRYAAPERRRELLYEMIDVMLLADEARDRGYDKDPMTQQELREILRDAMLKEARVGAPAPDDIPADEVRSYFDSHRADFHDPERRRISAIVLRAGAAATSALEAARKTGATGWGELVRARSIDPQAKADVPIDLAGDLGFVSPPGEERGANPRVPDAVRAAIYEVDRVGDVLPRVVEAGGQFYVIKLVSKSEAHDRSLDDAARSIRIKLVGDRIHAREAALLDDLRKQFPVEIDDAALAEVRVRADAGAGGSRSPR
ncbi:MAG: peptidylprolyl isomerase [Polyangiaceae bacterium]|jgi:hypothetical protein